MSEKVTVNEGSPEVVLAGDLKERYLKTVTSEKSLYSDDLAESAAPPADAEDDESEDPRDRELRERYEGKSFRQRYFIEFIVAMHSFATTLHGVPMAVVFKQKTCRYVLGYNASVCDDIPDDILNHVQDISNQYSTFRDIVSMAPGAIAAIVIGQYMTRYGMKAPLLSALIGAMITCLCQMGTFIEMSLPPYLNVLAEIPGSLTGGQILVSTAAYTSVGLRVPSNHRMFRMMLVGAYIGMPILAAVFVGGHLYDLIGMVWLEAVCVLLLTIPTYMVIFRFKDIDTPVEHANDRWREAIWDTLVDSVRNCWTSMRKVRPDYGREQLLCILLISIVGMTGLTLNSDLNYYFLYAIYRWPLSKYNTMQGISMGLNFTLVAPGVHIAKKFRLSDPLVIFVGSLFFVMRFYSLAASGISVVFFYVYLIIGFPFFVSLVSNRTYLTMLLHPDEMAIFFALVSAFEKAVPILSNLIAMAIYHVTVDTFSGAVFIVFGTLYFIPAILSLLCMRWQWLSKR